MRPVLHEIHLNIHHSRRAIRYDVDRFWCVRANPSSSTTFRWRPLFESGEADVLDRGVPMPRSSSWVSCQAAKALCVEAEQLEEVGRIDKDLPRFAEARLATEFAPHGCGLGKVAGADVMPNLVPLGWRQYPPQGLVRLYETIEPRGPILAGPTRRLVQEEDPAGTGGAADCLHQAQLVLGREMVDRQAAPGCVGMLRPSHHGLDEIAVIEIDFERQPGKIGGGELKRWL